MNLFSTLFLSNNVCGIIWAFLINFMIYTSILYFSVLAEGKCSHIYFSLLGLSISLRYSETCHGSSLVVCHVIDPVLFRILQYLQSVLLQKLNPHSLIEVSTGFGFEVQGRWILEVFHMRSHVI